MTEPDSRDERGRDLEIEHVADLANLPLDGDRADELADACADVLDAFQLPEIDEPEDPREDVRTFEDEADPWPEPGVEAILDAFPDRDGRRLRP